MKIIKTANSKTAKKMDDFGEKLSDLCHDQWSNWVEYLFSKCSDNEDGSVVIPSKEAKRWKRQMNADYDDLSEEEKDSDRREAKKFIALFNKDKDVSKDK